MYLRSFFSCLLMLCYGTVCSQVPSSDLFKQEMHRLPADVKILRTQKIGSGDSSIVLREITFTTKKGANTVYAITAAPAATGRYPAILFNHGGGGNAVTMRDNVITFAKRGYVTLACDQPGIAGTTNTPNSSGAWKQATGVEVPRFDIAAGAEHSTLFDAVVTGLAAFNWLAANKQVDPGHIGISGVSWGGYMTTFLSGLLGNRVKAAYSSFGCGYYDAGSFWVQIIADLTPEIRATWLRQLDAGRQAPGIRAPYFIETPSNDTYFWPEAVDSTLAAIPGVTNLVCMPNLNHKWLPEAAAMKKMYFDYYLKNTGQPFGKMRIAGTVLQPDSSLLVTLESILPESVSGKEVQLYYSLPGKPWPERQWLPIPATATQPGHYRAAIPANLAAQRVNYFAQLRDSRDVVTSSTMQQVAP